MNSGLILDLLLVVVALAAVVWAMAERGRAGRLEADLARAGANDQVLKDQANLAAGVVAEALVKRASQVFEAQNAVSQAKIEAQLKPVADTLEKFEKKVAAADEARARDAGGLKAHLDQLLTATRLSQEEARRLSTALRRGAGVQGRWGEQILRNVLELAGMKEGRDFDEQVHVRTGDGAQRPDVVVKLPRGGLFVIDAKCSLTAYLEAQEAVEEAVREEAFARHAVSVKGHMQSLAAKAYWEQFDSAPDFVAMFVPGDTILAAVVERFPDLYTQAMERRVILTTPSSLFALCMAVMYGWRIEQQSVNAREIAELGRELYKRMSVMGAHVADVGGALTRAVESYNRFVGSLESQVLTQARRFEDLKADTPAAPLRETPAIDVATRSLSKLAAEPYAAVLTAEEAAPTSAK
jgi:DNA recombination protein RmuC